MQSTIAFALVLATIAAGPGDFSRTLDSKKLDQPALDAEGYGEKKAFKREDGGLRVTLPVGAAETGWKTPQNLKLGGDFTIAADFSIKSIPKPGAVDGVAVGLAIAFNSIDQPDATFIREVEPDGSAVYRTIQKFSPGGGAMMPNRVIRGGAGMIIVNNANGMIMQAGGQQPAGPQARKTFPASGDSFRLQIKREGQSLRFFVLDAKSQDLRYLGQLATQPMDVAAVKLFVVNRSGAGAVDVVLKEITVRADRLTGLGTAIRTVFDEVVHGEPTAIEDGVLVVGAPSPTGPGAQAPGSVVRPNAVVGAATVAPAQRVQVGNAVVVVAAAMPVAAPAGNVVVAAAPVAPAQLAAPAQAKAATVTAPAATSPTSPTTTPTANGTLPDNVFAPAGPPKPKARLPLDVLEGVRFERQASLSAQFLGQPNLDFTQGAPDQAQAATTAEPPKKPEPGDDVNAPPPGTTMPKPPPKVEAKKNGIRDVQIGLSGLSPSKIRQIMVNCQTDKGAANWQLDTTGSPSWPLVLHRAGTEPTADLFLEPPPGDCHQKSFSINVQYEDGQAGSTSVQADGHSDPKLAVDDKAVATEPPDAWVYLDGDDRLFGKFEGIAGDAVSLRTTWKEKLEIPLSRIAGIHISLLERKETPEAFTRRLKTRTSEDLLLAQSKNGEVVPVPGVLEGLEGGRLKFLYQGKSRSLPLKQVEGIVLAARPLPKVDDLRATFLMPGGVSVPGKWKAIDASVWKVEAPWGQEMKLPSAEVREIRFKGGKMTYLSDLEPSRVEEASYFGRPSPWRRDVGLTGGKLKVDGRPYERGLAVHARCVLTYDLDGAYETFEAVVGFDEAARGKGRVDCRVFADDKELYANPDLRADAPAVPLKLRVAGASQLRLAVDFGADQDAGDRVVWADARLFRADAPRAAANALEPKR